MNSLATLHEGADLDAAIYKVQAMDKSSFFVKLNRGRENTTKIKILELLHDAGIQQIIPPVKTLKGEPFYLQEGISLTVYPFIEGINGFSCPLTSSQWRRLGQVLKQVHDLDLPLSVKNSLRQETFSPKWRKKVRSLLAHIQTDLLLNDPISQKFLTSMKEHKVVIQRLVDNAENLAKSLNKQPTKFVLCHSDLHGGNVLIKGDGTFYIIDWDAPILAPKERDLMFIGGGIANVWNEPEQEVWFYEGYGATSVNQSLLAYYRNERIVEDIAEFGEALLLSKPDHTHKNRAELYGHFIDMFDPKGVVDIALLTVVKIKP